MFYHRLFWRGIIVFVQTENVSFGWIVYMCFAPMYTEWHYIQCGTSRGWPLRDLCAALHFIFYSRLDLIGRKNSSWDVNVDYKMRRLDWESHVRLFSVDGLWLVYKFSNLFNIRQMKFDFTVNIKGHIIKNQSFTNYL